MPIPVTLPSVSADDAATILGQKCIFAFLEDGGTQVNLRAKVAGLTPTIEKVERKRPDDTSGLIVTGRTAVTGIKWALRLTFDEISTTLLDFFNTPYYVGTGRLWIGDPDDAENTVALLSNEFDCTVSPDGEVSFQADTFSEAALAVDIAGTFTLSADASTTA